MKKTSILIAFLITQLSFFSDNAFAQGNNAFVCNDESTPKVVKKLENYEIVSHNTGNIPTKDAFQGAQLRYSISAKPRKENVISINKKSGVIRVVANKGDNFDVQVTAQNKCGKVSTSFNIQIDVDMG